MKRTTTCPRQVDQQMQEKVEGAASTWLLQTLEVSEWFGGPGLKE